jgi:hypothetical protein
LWLCECECTLRCMLSRRKPAFGIPAGRLKKVNAINSRIEFRGCSGGCTLPARAEVLNPLFPPIDVPDAVEPDAFGRRLVSPLPGTRLPSAPASASTAGLPDISPDFHVITSAPSNPSPLSSSPNISGTSSAVGHPCMSRFMSTSSSSSSNMGALANLRIPRSRSTCLPFGV